MKYLIIILTTLFFSCKKENKSQEENEIKTLRVVVKQKDTTYNLVQFTRTATVTLSQNNSVVASKSVIEGNTTFPFDNLQFGQYTCTANAILTAGKYVQQIGTATIIISFTNKNQVDTITVQK